ncbi:MAG: NAD(P)-dependent oxidoreductase [Pseudomonadota bacterium]
MKHIAFLGLGAMGGRMATRLLDAGHRITVWNRSPQRTDALVNQGATLAESPKAAATGADVVLSMVRDDQASEQVWLAPHDGALQALGNDAIAIECSTVSLPHLKALDAAFKAARHTLVDAPLAGSRPQAEAGALIFFVGCEQTQFDQVSALLDPMAGAVHRAGDVGSGTTLKLMVNALFGAQLAVVAELLGFAEKAGMDPAKAMNLISATPVCSPAAAAGAQAMLAGAWAPAFPIDLVAKDFGLVTATAASVSADLPLCQRTSEVYAEAVDAGIGADNITGIVQRYAVHTSAPQSAM